MQVSLTIVQLHLILGNSLEACKRLRSIESIEHRPAVVSLLVNLYTHAGDIDGAVHVLDDSIAYAKDYEVGKQLYWVILFIQLNSKLR